MQILELVLYGYNQKVRHLVTLSIPTALFPSNSLWHCFSISSFIKWYTDVNIGCFDVADISAILTNFVSIISSVPEYG